MTPKNKARAELIIGIVTKMNEHTEVTDDFTLNMNVDITNHDNDEVIATALIRKMFNHSTATVKFTGTDPYYVEDVQEIYEYVKSQALIYKEE